MKKTVTVDLAENEQLAIVEKESKLPKENWQTADLKRGFHIAQKDMLKANFKRVVRIIER